ncbi:MFS transporter [Thalassotalea piscium]
MNKYYPWIVAALACLILMISNGLTITGLPILDESIIKEFGWSRGELKFRDMITFIVAALSAPLAGAFIDRYGVKLSFIIGWTILAIGYFLYSHLESLTGMYGIHVLFGFVLVFCGLNPVVIFVSQWFKEKRGAAIGIALIGSSLGGAIFPQIGNYINESLGWRFVFRIEIMIPLVLLIITMVLIKNNATAKAANEGKSATEGKLPQTDASYSAAIRSRSFWCLSIIAMTTYYSVLGVQAHLFLHMRDMDFSASEAANAITIFFIFAVIGKFIFGFMADIFNDKFVFLLNIVLMFLGTLLLITQKPSLITAATVCFGLGWGGVYTMIQLTAVNTFGLKSAGKILGTITVMDALGGGLGIWLTGVLYGLNNSYDIAFFVFLALITVALVCIIYLPKRTEKTQEVQKDFKKIQIK